MPPFKAVGERALEKQGDLRTASIIAMDPGETICLALEKKDFQELVMRQLVLEKGKRFTFLVKNVTEIFSSWTKAKILGLNENYVHKLRFK